MTYLHQALYKFWAQLGLPVYLQGRAPDNAVFPYVTINIIAPDTFRDASLTAFVWLKDDGNNANALRASYLDAASRLIPAEGVLLELPTGLV